MSKQTDFVIKEKDAKKAGIDHTPSKNKGKVQIKPVETQQIQTSSGEIVEGLPYGFTIQNQATISPETRSVGQRFWDNYVGHLKNAEGAYVWPTAAAALPLAYYGVASLLPSGITSTMGGVTTGSYLGDLATVLGLSTAGGTAVNVGSEALTGNTIGENASKITNGWIPRPIGELLNIGWGFGPRTLFQLGGTRLGSKLFSSLPDAELFKVPIKKDWYYRRVGQDAIEDAEKSGVIRGGEDVVEEEILDNLPLKEQLSITLNQKRNFDLPFFSKGKFFWSNGPSAEERVIVSKGNGRYNWNTMGQHGTMYSKKANNLEGGVSVTSRVTPTLPSVKGFDVGNLARTSDFTYYTKTPFLGWKPNQFKQPDIIKFRIGDIVDKDGFINGTALNQFYKTFRDLYGREFTPHKHRRQEFNKNIYSQEHMWDAAYTAQEAPLPEGTTRQEYVFAALMHDIGEMIERDGHGTISREYLNQLFEDVPEHIQTAITNHMYDNFGSPSQMEAASKQTPLTQALKLADVGSGEHYDDVIEKFPYLKYPQQTEQLNNPFVLDLNNWWKNTLKPALQDAYGILRHPTWQTAYHSSPYPFNIKMANMGTVDNYGLHFSPEPVDMGNVVYKVRIPKKDVRLYDTGRNNAQHISDEHILYDASEPRAKEFNMNDSELLQGLQKGSDYVIQDFNGNAALKLFKNNVIKVNPRSKVLQSIKPELREQFSKEAKDLYEEFLTLENMSSYKRAILPEKELQEMETEINRKVAELFHKYGIRVVGYNNKNPEETLRECFIVTSPEDIYPIRRVK